VSLIERITSPADVRDLTPTEVAELCAQIRQFLVDRVSKTGGHLGPNLGVVELTVAIHRVFDSPSDAILWDTGHQAYVHKMLTGRSGLFGGLRREGGLSGYPSRQESPHDIIENSHASTALSYADGIAKAWALDGVLGGLSGRHVVAVIGDGALTGGMSWEALNNIAASDRPLIVVVNDNERSYSPTIGGLAHHLATLRTTKGYERVLGWGRRMLHRTPVVGPAVYDTLHGAKKGLKDVLAPQGMFEDLGLKYIGPVDGHDVAAVEHALLRAKAFDGPVIVHVITEKGRGYRPAETDDADRFHGVGVIDPDTGKPLSTGSTSWTSIFSDELCRLAAVNSDIVAITAAMAGPTGLAAFAERFPDRMYDVGIAEQHAVTSAAGLAFAGKHPVVAVYATFLNRAFDQVLMDVALHHAGVTFVLDRAGVTGDDGASHNGMWDISMLSVVPGLHLAAPRDESTLRRALSEATSIDDAPSVVRFPKGSLTSPLEAVSARGSIDVLHETEDADVLIVGVGSFAGLGLEVANRLAVQGIRSRVVDPRWLFPLSADLLRECVTVGRVVSIEDGLRRSGFGVALRDALAYENRDVQVLGFGLPDEFLDTGSRAQVLQRYGLTAQDISRDVLEWVMATWPQADAEQPEPEPQAPRPSE
jgi:1-deoxy-D-xylulose-5-phosphate synthase